MVAVVAGGASFSHASHPCSGYNPAVKSARTHQTCTAISPHALEASCRATHAEQSAQASHTRESETRAGAVSKLMGGTDGLRKIGCLPSQRVTTEATIQASGWSCVGHLSSDDYISTCRLLSRLGRRCKPDADVQ